MARTGNPEQRAKVEAVAKRWGREPTPGGTVAAYISENRWVADCPCNGAEMVEPGKQMVCGSCGLVHTVQFPKKTERDRIESILDKRPERNRNWQPHETPGELEAQNIERGIW